MKHFTLLFFLVISCSLSAQTTYWVSFKDKANSPYSLNNPQEFLSTNALARRLYFNLAIEESDLPLNSNYVAGIQSLDAQVKGKSKWLNAILVESSLANFETQAKSLNYVENVIAINAIKPKEIKDKFNLKESDLKSIETSGSYGFSLAAIDMIKGRYLHDLAFQGQNIDIGVMDNGFRNVDSNRFFLQANVEGRIRGQYNFVDDTSDVFSEGGHGAYVMSTLAAYVEDTLIGTAPKANFYLFTTEDDNAEGLAEEINWPWPQSGQIL
ncbi:MAG: S8 family serine peptidase [Chitinophagales bacterium]